MSAPILSVTFPMLVPSAANTREHYGAKLRRVRSQRDGALAQVMFAHAGMGPHTPWKRCLPMRIQITRIAARALDDDNLAYACKAIRDGVALAIGIDDGDPRIAWEYAQERPAPNGPHVRITIERR